MAIKQKIFFVINKLQKYFKIDLFYLIKGEFYLMLGKIINMSTAFVLALAWANWVTPDIYGSYQYILSLVAIISLFSMPGLGVAVIQATARKLEGSFLQGFTVRLKWGLLSGLASLIISGYYWTQNNILFSLCFLVIALFLPLFNASLIYYHFLGGKKLFNIQAKYDCLTQVIASFIIISTLFCIKKFLTDSSSIIILILIISIYYLSRTSLRLFFFIKTKKKYITNNKKSAKTVSYGKFLTLTGLLGNIADYLDNILLFHYLGAMELALYSFATLIPKQIKTLLSHISTLALPKLSIRHRRDLKKTFLKKICYLTAFISIGVLIYIIIAPFVYKIFFPQYIEAVSYSRLYALSIIPLSFSMIGGIFQAKMMTKEIAKIRIIVPTVKISLALVLIPIYGIWGAVIGILIARTLNTLAYLFLFKKV